MRFVLLLFALLLCAGVASAQYYADVVLQVAPDGSVAITGVSNHPLLQPGTTQTLTTKNGEHWIFNLTIPETLQDYVIKVKLPKGASLNYVAAKNGVDISSEDGVVTVSRVGSNSSVTILIQYKLVAQQSANNLISILIWIGLVFVVGVLAALAKRKSKFTQKRKALQTQRAEGIAPEILDSLPQRQREIVLLLVKASHYTLTQKQLEERINIPKSSISRNVDALVRRGLIRKTQAGMTNTITLHERLKV